MKIRWDLFPVFLILLLVFGGEGVLVASAWLFNFVLGLACLGVAMIATAFFLQYLLDSGGEKE